VRPTSTYNPDQDVRDYLGANEVWKRSVFLSLKAPVLLRKPDNRKQKLRQREAAASAKRQALEQMQRASRRPFRGEVSVALTIFAPDLPSPPAADTTVKAYLDMLNGVLWADDRQVAHITVDRLAADNPRWSGAAKHRSPATVHGSSEPWVSLTAMPARVYAEHYERTFRLHDEIQRASKHEMRLVGRRESGDYFQDAWDLGTDEELDDLYRERRDAEQGRGIYSVPGYIEDEVLQRFRDQRIAELEAKVFLSERPGPGDRPGQQPEWPSRSFFAEVGLPYMDPPPRLDGPGVFRVQLPPESRALVPSEWADEVQTAMIHHRGSWSRLPSVFGGPMALDIAARGMGSNGKDIDNLAHIVLRTFESVYCAERRGTVTNYRAYRANGGQPGVRVMIMAAERLEQLDAAMDMTRDYLMRRGPVS
jgi:Holliday junction resolvase RusA-like endonuclease